MTKSLFIFAALLCATVAQADTIYVEKVRYTGEYKINRPLVLDSLTVNKKKYSDSQLIETPIDFSALKKAETRVIETLPSAKDSNSTRFNLASFWFKTESYANIEIKIENIKHFQVFVGGNKTEGSCSYTPGEYEVTIKYITDSVPPKISVIANKDIYVYAENSKRLFTLDDNMEMKNITSATLSPSGRYANIEWRYYDHKGKSVSKSCIKDLTTGRLFAHNTSAEWMPDQDKLYCIESEDGQDNLWLYDVTTGQRSLLATNLPSSIITMSPTADYFIYYISEEGPKKPSDVFEITHPDDRQPNYRTRYSLGIYDLKTGLAERLTYGSEDTYLSDISHDGRYLLFTVSSDSVTAPRPSELQTLYKLDRQTMTLDTLYYKQGFISNAVFFPHDPGKVLVSATPEAFGGIGRNLPENMTPNMFDYQLFMLADGKVTPLTKDFNPSVSNVEVSYSDNQIYFTAEDRDLVQLFRLDPKTLAISRISQPMEVLNGIATAAANQTMLLWGTSFSTPSRLYSVQNAASAKPKVQLVFDPNKERMQALTLSECKPLSFTCKRGYEVTGFYSLPANFDANKKYPMIVHYYGGCSPTTRRFGGGSHYPSHYWNALGYVVLIVNPSGASGFGQEWAARHVNTVGEGVAEDIIEATEYLADNNSFIDKSRIGCVSASYGGFMTQLILSKTNLFACGISHAGISDHTSYWGEGYWGYSYSQVSMANSYPWNRKDLYVDGSPLYNADKIHTPLLFTHGTADTNVPIGESIQMFTALKILGVPTAFVMVEGENHGITDYSKRKKWINTMMAWYQKWLKDDSSWWDSRE